MSEFKGYLKKNETLGIERRFADFNFLLFVASLMGVETSMTMGETIAREGKHDTELVALLKSF